MHRNQQGFTLIEVMVVVVIVGILASIAYPNYQEYVRRGHRAEGQAFLLDVAARQERYFAQNNSYVTKTEDAAQLGSVARSETGKYSLTLATGDGGFALTATPSFTDTKCGAFTLNARGVRGVGSGSVSACWR